METAVLMDHFFMTKASVQINWCVCYLVLLWMTESGLLLVDYQLTVALILFVVMLCLHQLISVSTYLLIKVLHHLMMVGTSVVYPLVVLILIQTSSLLIYSVSVLIVPIYTVICYWFTVGWAQIESITVDLPSDITVLPQTYTLHAIKVGLSNHYHLRSANWYYESVNPSTELCSGYRYNYNCSIGNGTAINNGNGTYDYTLTVIWNGENITSGVLSNNGNHVYRFYLFFGSVMRNHYTTVTGK